MLIALDTATRWAGLALYDGDSGLLAESGWQSANRHTEELMPAVAQIMARAGAGAGDLEAVAVALGPGSFTGLRVALAAAKGLALTLGIKIIGVPTLDVVAYPHRGATLPVVAVVQAGRGRVCWAPYVSSANGWAAQQPFALSTVRDLAEGLTGAAIVAGELVASDREALRSVCGDRAHLLPPAVAARRAGYLAELAWVRLTAGGFDDPAALSPIYLHQPPAPSARNEEG